MNPIRLARGGDTLEGFSAKCGVHQMALYYNECGVYPDVLPAVMEYLVSQGYDREVIHQDYIDFVEQKRVDNGILLEIRGVDLGPPDPSKGHPFAQFREAIGLSKSGFCKTFCVHMASVNKLERGAAVHLPDQVREALTVAGASDTVIRELNERCEEYARGSWGIEAA